MAALCALLGFGTLSRTGEAIPLLNGFGGPSGYGTPDHCVHPNDDGSYAGPAGAIGAPVAISLTAAFPNGVNFFGNAYRTFYLNTNGNITFRAALPTFTPAPFPISAQPMIAPWWGDVDTRGGGMPARNNICYHVEAGRVVVTWNNVGYYSAHDNLQNDFQMILSVSNTCTTTGDFDVEFRYNRCEWTTGDASGGTGGFGGTPAQVGFDAGDTRNYVALPMSRMMSILDVCRQTNVMGGMPGLWRFQIRGGAIAGGCMGGGTMCTVPMQRGACAQGVNICDGMGVRCTQVNMRRDERCNGFDDDCDGMVDNADNLCQPGQVCDRGSCVDRCVEEGCFSGRTCTPAGFCVETACIDVTCPEGQRCSGGQCVDPCSGVTCPAGQACRAGRCLNPCADVRCNPMEVCDRTPGSSTLGLCVPGCQCRPCGPGTTCQPDGYCVEDTCAGITCPTGQYCRAGACRDACEAGPDTRLCPAGERCILGECVLGSARPDAGTPAGDSGVRTDGSVPPPRDGGVGPTADSGPPTDEGFFVDLPRNRGCVCSTPGGSQSRSTRGIMAMVLVGLVAVVRRRRR
jgi:MYXO-CTERM domain-containing protein